MVLSRRDIVLLCTFNFSLSFVTLHSGHSMLKAQSTSRARRADMTCRGSPTVYLPPYTAKNRQLSVSRRPYRLLPDITLLLPLRQRFCSLDADNGNYATLHRAWCADITLLLPPCLAILSSKQSMFAVDRALAADGPWLTADGSQGGRDAAIARHRFDAGQDRATARDQLGGRFRDRPGRHDPGDRRHRPGRCRARRHGHSRLLRDGVYGRAALLLPGRAGGHVPRAHRRIADVRLSGLPEVAPPGRPRQQLHLLGLLAGLGARALGQHAPGR